MKINELAKFVAEKDLIDKIIVGIVMAFAIFVIAVIIGTAVFYLWNWLTPESSGVAKIPFWPTIAITALAEFLFFLFKIKKTKMEDDKN